MINNQFMRLALRLARHGLGTTSPNPTVGAVLVKGGRILGRGRTAPAGGPHAEIEAIRDAQSKKEISRARRFARFREQFNLHLIRGFE